MVDRLHQIAKAILPHDIGINGQHGRGGGLFQAQIAIFHCEVMRGNVTPVLIDEFKRCLMRGTPNFGSSRQLRKVELVKIRIEIEGGIRFTEAQ